VGVGTITLDSRHRPTLRECRFDDRDTRGEEAEVAARERRRDRRRRKQHQHPRTGGSNHCRDVRSEIARAAPRARRCGCSCELFGFLRKNVHRSLLAATRTRRRQSRQKCLMLVPVSTFTSAEKPEETPSGTARSDGTPPGRHSCCATLTFLSLINGVRTFSNLRGIVTCNLLGQFAGAGFAMDNVAVLQCFEGPSPRCC
jgi:hypothetical protein